MIHFITWNIALHLMHAGDWCTRIKVGMFDCTKRIPLPGPIVRHVTQTNMAHLIRNRFECSYRNSWYCTPNQIR